ncbi:hypothetical protein J7382_03225 [Shimia sp. R11_0]|uniref:DUF6868 domain-containing protein n=1 Tax=Shimia marina TaxID=321267 RepID=A0A0P1ETJ2_9RHOB|nr:MULTISPECIES: hypothetical protein [Shimia]MBO9476538.1 hypothetical protein [Shimia sp. R11_0]CUH53925.1 hypothetical protein SHM7688_03394 [Shimia marina]SFE19125.1 hypothetical protein SAMN04488037_106116 [Shimia marina]
MTQATLTAFFGWMTVIHIGLLLFATVMIYGLRDVISDIHARISGVEKRSLAPLYFQWLGTYKVLIFVFALVPWLALTLL